MSVSNQIIEVLDHIGNKFGIAIDWSSENILPMVQTLCEKYIRWEICSSVFYIAALIVLLGGYALFVKIYDKLADPDDKWDFDYNMIPVVIVAVGIILTIAAVVIIGPEAEEIIKCCTFPEMKMIEYVSTLIENMK